MSLKQYKGLSVLGYQRVTGIQPQIVAGSLSGNSVLHKSHSAPFLRLMALILSATIARVQETPGTGCRNSNRILAGSRRQQVLPCAKDLFRGARWESCQRQMVPFSLRTRPLLQLGTDMQHKSFGGNPEASGRAILGTEHVTLPATNNRLATAAVQAHRNDHLI